MGVPPKIPKYPGTDAGMGGLANSDFCNLTIDNLTESQQEYEDDFGVTVYNLGECDFPVGINFEADYNGYFCIMDVGEPVTITAKASLFTSTFTSYLIKVETNYPTFSQQFVSVRRRYNEFCWLREQLVKNHRDRKVPVLPPKKLFSFMNFNASFIQERLRGLSLFLQSILENPTFLKDPSLLFFLQSDLSVPEMVEMQEERRKGICHMTISSSVPVSCPTSSSSSSSSSCLIDVTIPEQITNGQNSLLRSSDGEDDDDDDDDDDNDQEVAKPGSSLISSGNSDFGRFGHHSSAKALPIPVPRRKMEHRLSTSSSEGDSGHFEASSSASSSPNGTAAVLIPAATSTILAPSTAPPPAPIKLQGRYRDRHEFLQGNRNGKKFIPSTPPTMLQVNEYLLYNPMSFYVMQ